MQKNEAPLEQIDKSVAPQKTPLVNQRVVRTILLMVYFLIAISIWMAFPFVGLLMIVLPIWLIPDDSKNDSWKDRLKNWKQHKLRTSISLLLILFSVPFLFGATSQDESLVSVETPLEIADEKTPEEIEEEGLRAQEKAEEVRLEREAREELLRNIVIVEEEDISYLGCDRLAVRVTVPDDALQSRVSSVLNALLYDYEADDVTIWAWNASERSQVGTISATRGTYERSTCGD